MIPKDIMKDSDSVRALQRVALDNLSPEGPTEGPYYDHMKALNHSIMRRLWIAEGKRRGYELVDA